MKTKESPGSSEATIAVKVAWLERRDTELDAGGVAVLREVFPTIMRDHYRRVWRRIMRCGVAEREAEDLLQEVFFALFDRVAHHGAHPSMGETLGKVMKGKLLHHVRDQRRAPSSVALPSSGSALPESAPDVDRAVDLRTLAQRLLPELSEAHRAVVEKVILGGLTHTEAAAALGLPEGTLKSRLRAAMCELVARAAPWLPPSQRDAA